MNIAVVIPCYKVSDHIMKVIESIGAGVDRIYVVDDLCPEGSGDLVETNCNDSRVLVIRNKKNLGVGGAVIKGYAQAIDEGMEVVVKIDGDEQMDTALIDLFVKPILEGKADYTKGNRFFSLEEIMTMPKIRILGNVMLSFLCKFSSGYWGIFDPTNGYTAIHVSVLKALPLNKIDERFFFESDMLFRLNIIRAVVLDIPMCSRYQDEVSNLKVYKVIPIFLYKHFINTLKRLFYNYYLRDMSIASIELPLGLILLIFGSVYGGINWNDSQEMGVNASAGVVMIASLPIIIGLNLILGFLNFDINSEPKMPIHERLK
jgi:glycosyltransferase involved in cell wall biosynthesis